jgi:hypothetical protein
MIIMVFYNTASADYNSIGIEEIIFMSDEAVNDTQCTPITILDDSNVLENTESFQITLSSIDPFVSIPSAQDNIIININEDPMDGSFSYTLYHVVANL